MATARDAFLDGKTLLLPCIVSEDGGDIGAGSCRAFCARSRLMRWLLWRLKVL